MIKLIELPYSYSSLEEAIDAKTVEIHYEKHHKGYKDNLLKLISGTKYEDWDVEKIMMNSNTIDDSIKTAVKNNAGGVLNHNLYWEVLSPKPKNKPEGELLKLIDRDFGSFENLKSKLIDNAKSRFGSGWTFLVVNSEDKLEVCGTANQDSPIYDGKKPILGIDVWEHSYYLRYQNRRLEYLENLIEKILNWDAVEKIYSKI